MRTRISRSQSCCPLALENGSPSGRPTDWTPGQVPGPGDDTTIGVSGSYTVSLSSATPTTVDSLTIGDANATFGIDAQQFSPGGTSLTVTGTLTNAGIINLGRSGLPASDTLSVRALSSTVTINLIGGSKAPLIRSLARLRLPP